MHPQRDQLCRGFSFAPARTFGRTGFTLIELTVVLALVALLTSVAVVKLREPYRRAKFASIPRRVEQLDRLVRVRAQRSQRPAKIIVDLNLGQVQAYDGLDERRPLSQLTLDAGMAFDRVMMTDRVQRTGRLTIPVGPRGETPSYALKVKESEGVAKWMLFAARTGQMIELESDREVRNILFPIDP